MWERIGVILRKEFIQLFRDPRMRGLLIIPPLLQLIIFGYAVTLDVDNAKIAWMDGDNTPESRALLARFEGSGRFQVVAYQMGMLTTFLPGFLLSGFVFSIDTMPKWIQVISVVVPSRYFITILKSVFLKGVGFEILWPQLVYLLLFTGFVFWRSVRRMHQKVA